MGELRIFLAISLGVLGIFGGCAETAPVVIPSESVTESASDSGLPVAVTYVASIPGSLTVYIADIGLMAPTRIKITPDGNLMFVAELEGRVWVYRKNKGRWVKQITPFYQLGDLGVTLESQRGLTGLFFGAEFDPHDSDPIKREIFFNYQVFDGAEYRNRISRVCLSEQGSDLVGIDAQQIYEGPEPVRPFSGGNHQIEDGIGFVYEGVPHILVSIADGFYPADALDETVEGRGKMLLMQRDGADPLGPRPFSRPKVQAIGLRNTYGIAMLPSNLDPRRRVLGVENGNLINDRIWLLELIDFGHEEDAPLSLGYTGSDTDPSWTSVPDLNNPGPPFLEGVLKIMSPTVAPTSLSLHPGKGIIPVPGADQATFLTVYFGHLRDSFHPDRSIAMGLIDHLSGQPSLGNLSILIQRSPEAAAEMGNPLGMDVDPATGDILFADVITGDLFQAVLTTP